MGDSKGGNGIEKPAPRHEQQGAQSTTLQWS
jgi:hypothetical protein